MRTIIAGSRGITDYNELCRVIEESGIKPTVILCGLAKGPDRLGELYGIKNNIPVEYFPADWETHKKAAGIIRNKQMLDADAEALIALWDTESKGTRNMINLANGKPGMKVHVQHYKIEFVEKQNDLTNTGVPL